MSYPTTDAKLLNSLSDPDFYDHQPSRVRHLQTHISHVFIASPFVYKIKKPLNLDFLDFSTLEKRKYYCRRELELNRRLCNEIYLEMVSIVKKNDTYAFVDGEDNHAVEYAVKMKKLDERLLLSEIIKHSKLTKQQLTRVAECLTPFYNQQEPTEEILKMGEPEKIKYNADENFQQTRKYIGDLVDKHDFEAIKKYTGEHFTRFEDLFLKRKEEKRIIDGHGDLRLEHVHLSDDRVCIFDCVEFNDRFRYQDVANDIAFLAMELDAKGLVRQSRHFIHRMQQSLEDPGLLRLIDFYKCYRAIVRAKVKSIESEEDELNVEQREEAAQKARKLYSLALRYALIGSGPVVLIFMGRVASGKSTLAERLADKLALKRFNSDRIRKAQFGLDLYERTPDDIREQIYSPEVHSKTYSILHEKMEGELNRGQSVIIDATFNREAARREIRKLLEERGVPYRFIEAVAPEEVLKERLSRRDDERSASDARLEDFEELDKRYQEPNELSEHQLLRVNTDQEIHNTLALLYDLLMERNLAPKKGFEE